MAFIGDFKSDLIEIGKGKDKKGEFTEYRRDYEHPCSCHPETCSHFDGTIWRTEKFKLYKDGTKMYL